MVPRKHLHRNGIRIAYSVVGEGPLVLFIHGLAMSSRAWLQSWQPLVERGFRVAAIDNRGTGQSTVSMPPYSMREMASDTAYLLEHLGGGPAIVAGLSLGGMIAQHLTIRNPHLVSGLVLAATTVGNPFGKLPRPEVLRTLTLGLLGHRRSGVAMRQYLVHAENLANDPDLFREFDRAVLADGVTYGASSDSSRRQPGITRIFPFGRSMFPSRSSRETRMRWFPRSMLRFSHVVFMVRN